MASNRPSSSSSKSNGNNQGRKAEWTRIYSKIWDSKYFEEASSMIWEPEPFLKAFSKASRERDGDTLRVLRKLVLAGTIKACKANNDGKYVYRIPNGESITYCQSTQEVMNQIAGTKCFQFKVDFDWTEGLPTLSSVEATEYHVVEGDCLEAAEALIARGLRPVVLNMASDHTPGGGYKGGAGAQEENLFRRSNLHHVLANGEKLFNPSDKNVIPPNRFYPLSEFSTVYSPSAYVFRSSEATGYAFLYTPYQVAFVAAAAYRRPKLTSDGTSLTPKLAEGFCTKVRCLLWTCAVHGHDSIILSAWGCGAFRNPPKHIAELFKTVLQEDWIKGRFKNVTFAIFDDHNARKEHNPEGNVKPFEDVFTPLEAPKPKPATVGSSSSTVPSLSSTSVEQSASESPSSSAVAVPEAADGGKSFHPEEVPIGKEPPTMNE